jgi:uncharacterized phiE125 gp8 family phage protein
MALNLVTPPEKEPITAAQARDQLRISHTDEDTLIEAYIKTARKTVEKISGHRLITQTWDYYLDQFPAGDEIELPFPPLQSVDGVYYTDTDGDEAEFSSDNYIADIYGVPGRVVLKSNHTWPTVTLRAVNGVRIRFTCGFGDEGSDVEEEAVQAVKLLVGHFYENREGFVEGTIMREVPFGVEALLADLRARAKRRNG